MTLSKGASVPAVTLKQKTDTGLEEIALDELAKQGPVVLLFFPLAFTSVCTEEMCSVSEGLRDYDELEAKVVGISVDSPFTLEVFATANKMEVPLLSDFNKEAAKAFGVLDEHFLPGKLDFTGVAKRSAFVAREGKIVWSWVSDDPTQLPPFNDLKAALKD